MTSIRIKRERGHITEVYCDGHTDYGEEGEDIVCAALSSIVQTAVLGLMKVAAIPVDYHIIDKDGILKITVPPLGEKDRFSADLILETMFLGIADLNEGYSKYIKLEVK